MRSPILLPIRMNAAETSASSAIADCTPLTVVPRSCTTAEIETFISEVSTTSTNIAIASRIASRVSPDDSSAGGEVVASSAIGRHHARRRHEVQGRETVVVAGSRWAPSEAVREAVTMALYVGVVLAAEFVAVEEHAVDEPSTVAVIWGTAIGVALAHVFAFNLAARLFAGGRLDRGTRRAVWAQLASASAVAFVVTVPFL